MDLADYYRPSPSIVCPTNGHRILEWEGFGGPGDWLVFEEGKGAPIDGRHGAWSPETRLPSGQLSIFGEVQGVQCLAHITVEDGLWTDTQLVDCDGAEPLAIVGDFRLWPVSRGRFCISSCRPRKGQVIPAFVTAIGHNDRVIVATRRARLASPKADEAWYLVDVEEESVAPPFDSQQELEKALDQRGMALPDLEFLAPSLR